MMTKIEVDNRLEARLIRRGLKDEMTRALVKVVGALDALPTTAAKRRALVYIDDYFREQDAKR